MPTKLSVREFFVRFPDDAACLHHLMDIRYGLRHECAACNKGKAADDRREWTFHRLADRKAYSCANCGHHIYPCAGTIFQDSRTSLLLWYYAIFLFVTTRHGVSGMEIHRALGVTKKAGWRIGHQIRKLMVKADGWEMLQGHFEADEAVIGCYRRGGPGGRIASNKTIIAGAKQRGGRIQAEVVPDVRTGTIRSFVLRNIRVGSTVSTDELASYNLLPYDGYRHGNLGEFTFRANHAQMQNAMFDLLVAAV